MFIITLRWVTLTQTTAETLGQRLRRLRTDAGLKQGQMAKVVGYGLNNGGRISSWERGQIMPTLPILHRYAQHFDITVAQLLEGVL